MIKKVFSVILCVLFLWQFSLVGFAHLETSEAFVYQMGGDSIVYYLDVEQNPYIYNNGEKMYISLSLPHLEVTDPEMLVELNKAIHSVEMRSVPTNYYDISYGPYNVNSPAYSVSVSLPTATSSFTTAVLKMNPSHEAIRIKTTNHSPVLSRKINLTFYYYDQANDRWYYQSHHSINCSGANGYGIANICSAYPYSQFFITKDSNLTSFTLTINTTYKA